LSTVICARGVASGLTAKLSQLQTVAEALAALQE
jgi:hypothetical protein